MVWDPDQKKVVCQVIPPDKQDSYIVPTPDFVDIAIAEDSQEFIFGISTVEDNDPISISLDGSVKYSYLLGYDMFSDRLSVTATNDLEYSSPRYSSPHRKVSRFTDLDIDIDID